MSARSPRAWNAATFDWTPFVSASCAPGSIRSSCPPVSDRMVRLPSKGIGRISDIHSTRVHLGRMIWIWSFLDVRAFRRKYFESNYGKRTLFSGRDGPSRAGNSRNSTRRHRFCPPIVARIGWTYSFIRANRPLWRLCVRFRSWESLSTFSGRRSDMVPFQDSTWNRCNSLARRLASGPHAERHLGRRCGRSAGPVPDFRARRRTLKRPAAHIDLHQCAPVAKAQSA